MNRYMIWATNSGIFKVFKDRRISAVHSWNLSLSPATLPLSFFKARSHCAALAGLAIQTEMAANSQIPSQLCFPKFLGLNSYDYVLIYNIDSWLDVTAGLLYVLLHVCKVYPTNQVASVSILPNMSNPIIHTYHT